MTLEVVQIQCSRCRRWVEGYRLEDGSTAGFVDVGSGRFRRYGRPGESHLCEACVQADPQYQLDNPVAHQQGVLGL